MAKMRWKLTDERRARIAPLLPEPEARKKGGRPIAKFLKAFFGF